jgi:hypothetical protein
MHSTTVVGGLAQARVLLQQFDHTFKLGQEAPCQSDTCFALVEPNGFCKVVGREPVDRAPH